MYTKVGIKGCAVRTQEGVYLAAGGGLINK